MGYYSFHDLSLEIQPENLESRADLSELLSKLSLVCADLDQNKYVHRLFICLHDERRDPPGSAAFQFRVEGFSTFEDAGGFYLSDGSSLFHIPPNSTEAHVYLAPSFFNEPFLRRRNFWSFGWLKLLRPLGYYSIHGAGLVAPDGRGLLVIGPSSSGKSTLALGLIRHGWRYLSDDALLLHSTSEGLAALALRKHFYIDNAATSRNSDLPLDDVRADNSGEARRRVRLEETPFAKQQVSKCIPEVLLCARIVPEPDTTLVPIDHRQALKQLLEGGGPQLYDRRTIGPHLQTLNALLRQCSSYELRAGRDIYHDPRILTGLLRKAAKDREAAWPALLSN